MRRRGRSALYTYLLFLFLFKLWTTVWAFSTDYPIFTSDAKEYITIARNLIEHGAFSSDTSPPFRHDVIRVPIYPLLLTVLPPKVLLLLQNVLVVLSSLVLFKRGMKVEGTLLLLSPTLSVFSNQNLTEGLYAPLMVFLLMYRGVLWGALWGFMALLRQATLVLFPPVALVLFWRRWRMAFLHLISFSLPVLAWAYLNYVMGHVFTPSAGFSTTLLVYLVGRFSDISNVISHEGFSHLGDWIRVVNSKVLSEILEHPVQAAFWWVSGSLLTLIKAIPRAYLSHTGNLWPVFYMGFYPYLLFLYRRAVGDRRLLFVWTFYTLAVGPLGDPRLRLPLEVITIVWPALREGERSQPPRPKTSE